MSENTQRGRDVSAPEQHVRIDGTEYTLRYSNKAARVAEDVYEQQYGLDKGYYDILIEMQRRKHRAIMAIVYGAMAAGGCEMPWNEFDQKFTLASLDAVRESVEAGIIASLPTPEGDAKKQ